jgi:HEAT repeat protein
MLAVETLTDLQPEAAVDVFLSAAKVPNLSFSSGADAKLAVAMFMLKRAAIYGLGYTKSERAWSFLVGPEALDHPDFRIRATSVRSLGVLEKEGTEAYLLPRLKDPSAEVRWGVCSVLGRIGSPASGPALQATLHDSHSYVRKEAALGLGYLKFTPAKPDLAKLAENDDSRQVRRSAALALSLLE